MLTRYLCLCYPRMQSALDLPMAMRYRNLQKTYKNHVGVFQSGIHGLGLYCVREIEPGEMVIEYAGTVIRSVLTDKREKLYESKVCVSFSVHVWCPYLCGIYDIVHLSRVLDATCSVLIQMRWWMPPCLAMKQGS